MSSFKIYGKPEEKFVILKGDVMNYQNYTDLKTKLITSSRNPQNKGNKLKETDKFILIFGQGKDEVYIPSELSEGIWNNNTFDFFKEKLSLRGIKNKYKFIIKKVDRYPIFKRKENHIFLKEALKDSWEPIYQDIVEGVGLSKLEEGKAEFNLLKNELKKNEELLNKEEHKNIICNNCFKQNLKGKRFICAECNNYNLCQDCEKTFYQKQFHQRDHTLIQINKSLGDEISDNFYKYNNIIGNNNQEFKNVPSSFQLEITVINNGENDLKGCYILPVRYGDEYLTCGPKVIKEEIQRNMSVKISLIARLPQSNKGYFEGYFRMFTPHGLPFGNVLYVQVLNGD